MLGEDHVDDARAEAPAASTGFPAAPTRQICNDTPGKLLDV